MCVVPPITTHVKIDDGGRATHAAATIPTGSSGPWTQFCSAKYKISVLFETFPWSVSPPIMMMHFVDPSSDWIVQFEWQHLGVSNGGPQIQLFRLTS